MFSVQLVITVVYSINLVISGCPENSYGPACMYECHCDLTQICDSVTGCTGRCDTYNGWDGSTCQRKNVVLRRPTVQGPDIYCTGGICYDGSLVVDGVTGHHFYNTPCAMADSKPDSKAWWKVTLDQEYYINKFSLYNRMDGAVERINGFVLSVGRSTAPGFNYTDCYRDSQTGVPPDIRNGTCINNTPLKGNVIQVKQTTMEPLAMCELVVYVCAVGWYGDDCGRMCNTTTACVRCDLGQLTCQECAAGRWGEHCPDTCHCLEEASCNKTSGRCPGEKCAAGFKGDTCNQTCDLGEYGPDCALSCGYCYTGRLNCSKTNGYCPEGTHTCQKGFKGPTCHTECSDGKWDFDCIQSCGNCRGDTACNKTSGICPQTVEDLRCKPGYLESDLSCKQACSAGTWGDNCAFNCSVNCFDFPCAKDSGTCPGGCRHGYSGEKCDTAFTDPQTGTPSGGIIGGSVGGAIGVILIVIAIVIFRRRIPPRDSSSAVSLDPMKAESTSPQVSPKPNGTVHQNVEPSPKPKLKPKPIIPVRSGHENKGLDDDENRASNPYVNVDVTSASVTVEDFCEHVAQKKAGDEFKTEFETFPVGPQLKHDVASRQENRQKNRYKYLIAYDNSRVVLNNLDSDIDTGYINACYINGYNQPKKYIASQGPTGIMINDFLRMIFEQNTGRIVMLTNLFEDTKLKCLKYWPETDTVTFGLIKVKLHKQEQFADYIIRELHLTHLQTNSTNKVTQFHYTSWPDHGVPTHSDGLIEFRDKVNNCDTKLKGPIIVHCSAGVGRSGTYIAFDYLLEEAQALGSVDVIGCVHRLREQRVNMIQTEAQYAFLHETLLEAFRMGDSSVSSVNFTNAYNELSDVNPMTGRKRLAEQFEELCSAIPASNNSNKDRVRDLDNIGKNRNPDIFPDDDNRPYLSTPVPRGTDYINAVFLPAYKTKRAFIITQMPLTNTVVDFWRLVYDHSVNTIVMLNTEEDDDGNVGVYWTEHSETFGPFVVSVTDRDTTRGDCHIWTYNLKYNNKDEVISVKQFRCKFWSDTMSQIYIGSALTLIDQILKSTGKDPVIVHCMDGFSRSGLFCTACVVMEKIKMDFEVNILQAVKKMRIQRSEIITDLEQYDFLHKLVLGYLESFQVYANFSPFST